MIDNNNQTACVEEDSDDLFRGCRYINQQNQCELCNYGYYNVDGRCERTALYNNANINVILASLIVLFF